MDPTSIPLPLPEGSLPAVFAWLEQRGGVAGALLVAALWIWTLLRERTLSQRQNERLSDALCRSIESGSSERAKLADEYRLGHDWTVRSLLDAFTALVTRRESSVLASHSPRPRQPTSIAPSEPTPPPVPPPLPNVPKRRAT